MCTFTKTKPIRCWRSPVHDSRSIWATEGTFCCGSYATGDNWTPQNFPLYYDTNVWWTISAQYHEGILPYLNVTVCRELWLSYKCGKLQQRHLNYMYMYVRVSYEVEQAYHPSTAAQILEWLFQGNWGSAESWLLSAVTEYARWVRGGGFEMVCIN